jgi:methionyl aminopeptidase
MKHKISEIERKTKDQVVLMRQAGRIVAEVLATMVERVRPGVTTAELDRIAEEIIRKRNAIPSFKGYPGNGRNDFPASVCASINEEIVHGIPSQRRVLRDGDILSVDVGAIYNGFHGDAAITLAVGEVDEVSRRLIQVTDEALRAGILHARQGNNLWGLIRAVQSHVERNGFSVLHEYQGHGIGREMHEKPDIPNFLGNRGQRPKNYPLLAGMTLALEPMVVTGSWRTRVLEDGWTVVTADGSRAAHSEHTILVTDGEPEILTRL